MLLDLLGRRHRPASRPQASPVDTHDRPPSGCLERAATQNGPRGDERAPGQAEGERSNRECRNGKPCSVGRTGCKKLDNLVSLHT